MFSREESQKIDSVLEIYHHCFFFNKVAGLTRAALLASKEGEGDGPDGDATTEHF